eukprot:TRINITY_DN12207_c0_g1_i1.p1 TRINITY_DN12207_c0_g1~~TRINITY_DN12207_c0_g1_i1.p1  ORF type:complete len:560 (-),score=169.87 TRINITY_DN12207_c0_g1_i1:1678-3357(-)
MSKTLQAMQGKEPGCWGHDEVSALVAELSSGSCDNDTKNDIVKTIGDLAANDAHREYLFSEKSLLPALLALLAPEAGVKAQALAARAAGNLSYDHEESARAAVSLGIHTALIGALSSALDQYPDATDASLEGLGLILRNCSGALANFASAGLEVQEQLLAHGALDQLQRVLQCGASHAVALIMASRGVSNLADGEGAEKMNKSIGAHVATALYKAYNKQRTDGDGADAMLPHAISALSAALRTCCSDAKLAAGTAEAEDAVGHMFALAGESEAQGRPFYVKPSSDRPPNAEEEEEEENEEVALNGAIWDAFDAMVAHDSCAPLLAPHTSLALAAARDLARFDHGRASSLVVALTASEANIAALMEHCQDLGAMLAAEPLSGQPKLLALFTNLASTEANCQRLVHCGLFQQIASRVLECDIPPKPDLEDDSAASVVVGRMYVASTSEELDRFRVLYNALTAVRNFAIAPFCKEIIAQDDTLLKRIIQLTTYENPHLRWVAVCLLRSLASSERAIEPMRNAGAVSTLCDLAKAQLPDGQRTLVNPCPSACYALDEESNAIA